MKMELHNLGRLGQTVRGRFNIMRTPCQRRAVAASDMQAVQVYCRIKPNTTGLPSCIEVVDENTLKTMGVRAGAHKETLHSFTAVYREDVSQDTIFQNVALPIVSDFLDGKNGLLLTYGTTGSGKTYAMQGNTKETGILPLTLDVIFNSLENNQTGKYVLKPDGINGFDIQSESDAIMDRHRLDYQHRLRFPGSEAYTHVSSKPRTSIAVDVPSGALYAVFISLVEVYNNNVYDLLRESPNVPGKAMVTHMLREDAQRNIYVSGCVEAEVKNADDALRIFATGQKRRRVGQTALNAESSRSHCVFNIRLVRTGYDAKYKEAIEDKNLLTVSQLCLVDLAGSERANRAGTQGDRLKEASSINNCLMNLRKCIQVLREVQLASQCNAGLITPGGSARVVPYRDRRLTHMFKNYFEGNGRVVILVCVRQSVEDYDETIHVLKFAESSQEVSTFRTPGLPLRSPAPNSHNRPHYMQPVRRSARSDDSDDTSTTASMLSTDDYTTSIMQELNILNADIDRGLLRLLDDSNVCESDHDIRLSRILMETQNIPTAIDSDDYGQDSAPEQDRSPGGKDVFFSTLHPFRKFDLEPLRALFTQRLECRQRASVASERDHASFRAHLVDLLNTDMAATTGGGVGVSWESTDRLKLEARIRRLENQVIEKEEQIRRERGSRTREIDDYRSDAAQLRGELKRLIAEDGGQNKRSTRLRPSMSHQNLVSVLSRQWENRAVEQQKVGPTDRTTTTTMKKSSRAPIAATGQSSRGRVVAAFNPRHRRSRSMGAEGSRWLEHQETNPAPLGTVFSPKLKRRKSVTQVELKDTLKASNYLLHHQEATADGGVETKLYKGSIIPTAGGGSAVIFDDVEHLRQISPLSAQRKSSKHTSDELDSNVHHRDSHARKSKRPRSSSSQRQVSLSSTNTEQSDDSAKTTTSSNYRAISPLSHAPILANHLDNDAIRDRCRIGLTSSGGVGVSSGRRRKRSRF